jgi:DNA/RNA endonuclease G (NUC1)
MGDNNEWVYATKTVGTFPKLVHVPSHFFKVIVARRAASAIAAAAGGQPQQQQYVFVGAFMVPNVAGIHKQAALKEFVVSLADLESLGT